MQNQRDAVNSQYEFFSENRKKVQNQQKS